eukprot:scaffold1260_cov51-Phaeocystis_antarctica.AAC.2
MGWAARPHGLTHERVNAPSRTASSLGRHLAVDEAAVIRVRGCNGRDRRLPFFPGTSKAYTAPTWRRHQTALLARRAFTAGAGCSAAARSKCVAASLSSAAERGPASHTLPHCPRSTTARISLTAASLGAAPTTLADSALSPSSFHHSGLATSAHTSRASMLKAAAVASAQSSEPTGKRSLASRNRCAAST